MILLTRLSGSPFVLNSDLIERIDSTPDTIVTLVDGSKYVVREDLRDLVTAVRHHRAEVIALSEALQIAGAAVTPPAGHQEPDPVRPALSVVTHPDEHTDEHADARTEAKP